MKRYNPAMEKTIERRAAALRASMNCKTCGGVGFLIRVRGRRQDEGLCEVPCPECRPAQRPVAAS